MRRGRRPLIGNGHSALRQTQMSNPAWQASYDVFISYARRDGLERAARLEKDLSAAGLRTWRDKRQLDPDKDFTAELEQAIEQCVRVVCCITPDTKRDDSFVRREISYALAVKKPVIPLVFDNTIPHIPIVNITREDFTSTPWTRAVASLLQRLRRSEPDPDSILSPPADSYHGYLERLYGQLVSFLSQTVFSEIALYSESTSTVAPAASLDALPSAFWALTGALNEDAHTGTESFTAFRQAYERFGQRVLLLGEPGGGKTTTLFAFARDRVVDRLHDPALPLPIIAPVVTWNPDPPQPLAEWLASQSPMLDSTSLTDLLNRGRALVMCDGLDELGSFRRDEHTREHYDPRLRFLNALPEQGPLVITCRAREFAQVEHPPTPLRGVTLKPLDDRQLREYLAPLPPLADALANDQHLRDVVRTPLLLSILTHAYRDSDADLDQLRNLRAASGEVRDKIFGTYVRRRLQHEQRKLRTSLQFGFDDFYATLGLAAVEGMSANGSSTVEESIQSSLADRAAAFSEEARRLHLLIDDATRGLAFRHLLLRDHFGFPCALECVKTLTLTDHGLGVRTKLWRSFELLAEIGDPRALEPLLGHIKGGPSYPRLTGPNDAAGHIPWPLAESLFRFGDSRVLVAYARSMSSRSQPRRDDFESEWAVEGLFRVSKLLAPELMTSTLVSSMTTGSVEERADYAMAIGMLRLQGGVGALIAATRDENGTVRACAAWALGLLDDPASRDVLRALRNDNGTVRREWPQYTPWSSRPWSDDGSYTVGRLAHEAMEGRSRVQRFGYL